MISSVSNKLIILNLNIFNFTGILIWSTLFHIYILIYLIQIYIIFLHNVN